MGIMTLVGDDSLVINDYPIHTDFQDGDTCTIDFPNDLFLWQQVKTKIPYMLKMKQVQILV